MPRDIRTVNMIEGQKIESDDVMKRIGDLAYRNLGTLAKTFLFDSGKALIVGDGIRVEPSSLMTVNVPSGSIFQRFIDVIPCLQIEDQTVTLDAASGSPRVDIVEAQIKVITDKDDLSQVATVATGTAIAITNQLIKRDIKYYLSARKQTSTTTPTAATAGELTGTVAIPGTIDLSVEYLLNLSDGEDGSYQEIDCRGAVPTATTRSEIITAINNATGRTMASTGGGDVIVLTGEGTGQTSYFSIKPPVTDTDKDCLELVFGVSIGGIYKYTYEGTNEWFKLAEIDVGAATTVITSGLIRNVDQKSTWASGGDDILLTNSITDFFDGDTITVDTITEKTTDNGIDIEGINLKDGDLTFSSGMNISKTIGSQSAFENIIERTGANTYQIKDDYKSVLFKNITGGYAISGVLSGGDTWGDIETNNCADIEFESGAYLYFANLVGQLTVNTDDCHLKNVWVKGAAGAAAAITNSFELDAYRVTFNNCKASTRLSNAAMIGFDSSATSLHNITSKYINCSVFDMESSGNITGFYGAYNISNGVIYNIECTSTGDMIGFDGCLNISTSSLSVFDLDSGDMIGFSNCYNISACNLFDFDSISGAVYGIKDCYNISACYASQLTADSGSVLAFYNCDQISSCYANDLDSNSGVVVGFTSCDQISSCYANDLDSNSDNAIGFTSCDQISSCYATDIDSVSGYANGFRTCEHGAALHTTEALNGTVNDWMDSGDAQITNNYSIEDIFT